MVNYEHGKVYRLKSKSTNKSYIGSTAMPYLSKRLAKHIHNFKIYNNNPDIYNYMTSFEILKQDDYEIELIINYPCANKQQLEREEGKYILKEKEDNIYECVNKVIAGRTHKEYLDIYNKINEEKIKDYKHKWYEENKEKLREIGKKYYEENKEKIAEIRKKYSEENKDKIAEMRKKYCEQNKEKVKEQSHKQYEKHKDKISEKGKEYRMQNKEKIAERNKKYRETKKDYFREKIECNICKSIVSREQLKKHQKTLKCQAVANLNNVCKDIEETKI